MLHSGGPKLSFSIEGSAWANEEADVCDMHTHLNAAVVHHLQRFNKP
jgi:hypothetical protein